VYLFDDSGGDCANYCNDVNIRGCEIEGVCETGEHYGANEETYDDDKVWFVFDGGKEEGCGIGANCEIQNADGSHARSHQGNSNCAGGVGFLQR
jgi:hypothetical protein